MVRTSRPFGKTRRWNRQRKSRPVDPTSRGYRRNIGIIFANSQVKGLFLWANAASRRPGPSKNSTTPALLCATTNGQQLAYVYFEDEPGRRFRRPSCSAKATVGAATVWRAMLVWSSPLILLGVGTRSGKMLRLPCGTAVLKPENFPIFVHYG